MPRSERQNGKVFRIRTYADKSCKEAIDKCKPGQKCLIKGEVGVQGDLWTSEFASFPKSETNADASPNSNTKTYKKADGTVVTWIRDTSNPHLGEAWRDPSGMIWGDVARNEKGEILTMGWDDARIYCESRGAQLPSLTDLERIRTYSSKYDDGPEVLPNVVYVDSSSGKLLFRLIWSSTADQDGSYLVFVVSKNDSWAIRLNEYNKRHPDLEATRGVTVRCVVPPR